jgi:hypothetical protein
VNNDNPSIIASQCRVRVTFSQLMVGQRGCSALPKLQLGVGVDFAIAFSIPGESTGNIERLIL